MNIETRYIPGNWCDVSDLFLVYQEGNQLHVDRANIRQFSLTLPEQIGFLRVAHDVNNNICTVSQGQSGNLVITYNRGIVPHGLQTLGNSPCIVRALAQGQFEIHVMTPGNLLRCLVVNGEFLDAKPAPIPATILGSSQGLLGYGLNGDLRWVDHHIHANRNKILDKYIGYPDLSNGLYVGQHHESGLIGISIDNKAFFIDKQAGDTYQFAHVTYDGNRYYACAFTKLGVMYSVITKPFENQDIYPVVVNPNPGPNPEPEKPMLPVYDGRLIRSILENTWNYVGKPNLGASSTRESRNEFWAKFCAVMHYGHPGLNPGNFNSNWGNKARSSSSPTTDDTLAWKSGNGFYVGDMITSAGADNWSFHDLHLEGNLITDQAWIQPKKSDLPASNETNPNPNPNPGPTPPLPSDLSEIGRAHV